MVMLVFIVMGGLFVSGTCAHACLHACIGGLKKQAHVPVTMPAHVAAYVCTP